MVLFKNRLGIALASIVLILFLSIYHKPVRKVIHEKFQDVPTTTEPKDLCHLNCSNKDIMNAVKQQFETKYVEGFSDKEGFQDVSQLLSLAQKAQALSSGTSSPLSGLPGVSAGGATPSLSVLQGLAGAPPSLGAFSSILGGASTGISIPGFSATPQVPIQLNKNNLKKIRRAFKIDELKCEYNIEYDQSTLKGDGTLQEVKDVAGYIQATFVKESPDKCDYKPVEVKLLIGPQIIRYDSANPDNIVPFIDYVF